jgi:hypothetical protein
MALIRPKLFLVFAISAVLFSGTAFAQQEKQMYGQTGHWELGFDLYGSYNRGTSDETLSTLSIQDLRNDVDIEIDAFVKYFLFDHFHLGAKLSYKTILEYDDISASDGSHLSSSDGSHSLSLLVSPGYTIALSPLFQIDLSLLGGVRAAVVVYPSTYFSYAPLASAEVTLLFPVIESVVIGFGYHFTILFWPQQSIIQYSESLGYDQYGSVNGLSFEHGAKFQVSFYF